MSLSSGQHILYTPREALQRCSGGSVMLDIRPEILCVYKGFGVPEVLYCPWREIGRYLHSLPSDREIIVADSSGIQAREVIDQLLKAGFVQVAGLAGGMVEWERDGLPLVLDQSAQLSGSCMCQLKFRNVKHKT